MGVLKVRDEVNVVIEAGLDRFAAGRAASPAPPARFVAREPSPTPRPLGTV
jgi:hypothetical protein